MQAKLEKINNTEVMTIRFSYNPKLVDVMRQFKDRYGFGKRWYQEEKFWAFKPDAIAEMKPLLSGFDIDQALLTLAGQLSEQKQANLNGSSKASTVLDFPHPDNLEYMPFQKAGIEYVLPKSGALIADEMGLGKTIQAIGTINASEAKNVLIVCPKSVILNWKRELEKWLTKDLSIGIADTKSVPTTNIVISGYETLRRHIELDKTSKRTKVLSYGALDRDWDLIVGDEAHFIKNGKAQRSKTFKACAKRSTKKLLLTGTPIVNRPIELWELVHLLDPKTFDNFMAFAKRYCNARNNGYGWDFNGASNLPELHKWLRETIMVRRLKKDVLTELPAKVRQVVEFSESQIVVNRERKSVSQWKDRIVELKAKAELSKAGTKDEYEIAVRNLKEGLLAAFTEIAKIRHETALAKVPFVIEYIQEVLADDEDKKVIVFAHHKDVIAKIAESFCSVTITGDTPMDARQQNVDSFQNNPQIKLFVGSITASGIGITLTASSHVIFAELDWVPGNLLQCEDRAHRIGQESSVLVQHLVLENSIDAALAKKLIEKQKVIDSALDGKHDVKTEPIDLFELSDCATAEVKHIDNFPEIALDEVESIHEKLKVLASYCDGAHQKDGSGFSKVDARIGHSLANAPVLSQKQAYIGQKIVHKYRRQLS